MSAQKSISATEVLASGEATPATKPIPVEAPIAIEFNGVGYAVMMATPIDLEDFARGFSLSEGIVGHSSDIKSIIVQKTDKGWILRIMISSELAKPMMERVRVRVSESSCGLCGMENLEQIFRSLPQLPIAEAIPNSAVFSAIEELSKHQPLNSQSGGLHAAAFCDQHGIILHTREDVGRHNALDKLIGTLAQAEIAPASGFFLLTSRCSYELVEKTIIAGCPVLVTVSTATSLAVDRAAQSGLRLVTLARPEKMLEVRPAH